MSSVVMPSEEWNDYPICPVCHDYVMACICYEIARQKELDEAAQRLRDINDA